ncbi:transketolase [Paenibacillus koleovorans]|uniref:transketolase n=1 Tax=Paenibacillus koleovorans TaxID=121608 RepID=UPI001FE8DDFC|nr:transketolase [Paenibacillus koleovorans]
MSFDESLLRRTAQKLRENIVRMVEQAGSGHNGGSLSAIDILTYLYFHRMNVRPQEPLWPDRDRFVLSKGHCSPALYAVLAERGYYAEETLWTLRDIESKLQGHPDMNKTPGVDMTTGSLGQGFSCATGMALGAKLQGKSCNIYVMLGDGELQEGQVWEAAMAAAHYGLDHLIAFVDNNKLETDGFTKSIMNVEPIAQKFEAFGWNVYSIDGHCLADIHEAVEQALEPNGRPTVIVAETVKGKGVSFMENDSAWHAGPTTPEQTELALRDIKEGAAK